MQESKKGENRYTRITIVVIFALFCFIIGVIAGILLSKMKSEGRSQVRSFNMSKQETQSASPLSKFWSIILRLQMDLLKNPGNAEAWARLGHSYFDISEFQNAIYAYQRHLHLAPDNANVWTDLGIMYRRTGLFNEAIKAFNKAINIDPKHQLSRYNKGIVLMHDLNDRKGAIMAWEGLIKINPSARTPEGQLIKEVVRKLKSTLNQ